jgi:hypothetical protein
MIVYLAIVGTLACLASIGRLVIAWADFRRRWPDLVDGDDQVPTSVRLPAGGWMNRA